MTVFWILAAGLIGLALLFIVPPILRNRSSGSTIDENEINLAVFRQQLEELDADLAAGNLDQAQYDAARRDLEKELLLDIEQDARMAPSGRSGRWAAFALSAAVPAAAIAFYLGVGEPSAVQVRTSAGAAVAHQGADSQSLPPMEELVAKLAQRMETDPDNVQGWVMLGRSYLAMDRPSEAVQALEKAIALAPDEPVVLLGLAEAVTRVQRSMAGRPAELVARALEIEPGNPNGLWMMGLFKYQQEQYAEAVKVWTQLLAQLQPGGKDHQMLQGYIRQAKENGGLTGAEAAAPETAVATAPAAKQPATAAAAIQVDVSLAPELAGRADPEDTLFVFARAASGPPMPLAVQRLQVKDLPLSVKLDDGMAMMPQMRLSAFDQVVVGARVSKSGNAMPQSGDLQGEAAPVNPAHTHEVKVVIDGVRP